MEEKIQTLKKELVNIKGYALFDIKLHENR